ncbi:hypothetical protein evm_005502 [Chilo suppressalis]|nr:hypothetical protein evm_005502 [Chilo suppressalis]
MEKERVVSSRPDREIKKKIITPGDYTLVPYEDSRCKIVLSHVTCTNSLGKCEIEPESRIFSKEFDGNVLIGDTDNFIDKDFELILQQMCCGETCEASLLYRDSEGVLVKEIKCNIELKEVTDEQLVSDWGWQRLYESALHHKERGVELVKQKRLADAFRRFNKALKFLIAIEPVDPDVIEEETIKEMIALKVKLYNNLAHIQLQYNEYEPALQLCNRAIQYDPENTKALYRRCTSYTGLQLYEEAWADIQHALKLDPSDKASQQKAKSLRPIIEKINKNYTDVVKKMFG